MREVGRRTALPIMPMQAMDGVVAIIVGVGGGVMRLACGAARG